MDLKGNFVTGGVNKYIIWFYGYLKFLDFQIFDKQINFSLENFIISLPYFYKFKKMVYSEETVTDVSYNKYNKFLLCLCSNLNELEEIIEEIE